MAKEQMKKISIILFLFCFVFTGYLLMRSSTETDRDIVKYDGRIYSNITDLDWFTDEEKGKYQKGERIGEVKKNSRSSLLLWNFSATKLQKGTDLYHTCEKESTPLIILAETQDGNILFYRWLPKE